MVFSVIPAQAGIFLFHKFKIPAYAGMTNLKVSGFFERNIKTVTKLSQLAKTPKPIVTKPSLEFYGRKSYVKPNEAV